MYRKRLTDPMEFLDFYRPFGGRLDKGNRWAKLAERIPWDTVEEHCQGQLAETGMGAPAKSGRVAFIALNLDPALRRLLFRLSLIQDSHY